MASAATESPITLELDVPQWKKDLIARLRNQNKMNEERLWTDHHLPHPRTDLVCPMSPDNGFHKDGDSASSSDSEDLHYGPGIVNRLKNKYLSLAFRESNCRPTILRKATSLENLLDDEVETRKDSERLFTRRNPGKDWGSRYSSSNRRQEMKRARSVEVISRTHHDEELSMTSSVTTKINNRQSLHEDMLSHQAVEKKEASKLIVTKETGHDDTNNKIINRPKRIPPLLNEREKPPVDVVKHAKMIFEKRPETRTKKPQHTGEVASKIDSFNEIIVKTKGALKSTAKPAIKCAKPVLYDKYRSNTQHHIRPVAKPVILNEELAKPRTLEIRDSRQDKGKRKNLPSPIPDVSRVEIKSQEGREYRGNSNALSETPDLILTSSPISKIHSPTFRKKSTENFIEKERNGFALANPEATNKYVSPMPSPTKSHPKSNNPRFHNDDGFRMISPISQNNITNGSATSIYNFLNSQVDQRHLPADNMAEKEAGDTRKKDLSPFEIEKNLKNVAKSMSNGEAEEMEKVFDKSWQHLGSNVEKTSMVYEKFGIGNDDPKKELVAIEVDIRKSDKIELIDRTALKSVEVIASDCVVLKPVKSDNNVSAVKQGEEKVKIGLPKKPKPKQEEATCAVFNFTSRKDVPDYISNDSSRLPVRPVIPKPDEPGIKLLPDALRGIRDLWEEDELVRSLEARPPSPCDITFVNDNIIIDGRSSLINSSSKRIKLKISFIDDAEIFEYPSETSLLLEEMHQTGATQVGHSVPTLSGSSLATYTPKTTEDFQLGITKTFHELAALRDKEKRDRGELHTEVVLEEIEKPVLFSSGSTSDILF